MVEQWWRSWWWCDNHGDQVLGLEKKQEKNKKLKAKVKLDRNFLVWWWRHLTSVITFRIDSCTIKRGETRIEMQLSKWSWDRWHYSKWRSNDEDHDDGVTMAMIKCLDLEKKKEKNKKLKAKVKFDRSFLVWWSRHLASVITFMLDSHTIKRGETRIEMQLSKCH